METLLLRWQDDGYGVKDGELRVFMVAGRSLGHALASRLIPSLKQMSPFPVSFSAVGGYAMFVILYLCFLCSLFHFMSFAWFIIVLFVIPEKR